MEEKMFEIYFSDLNEHAQKELLELAGVKDPKDMNWDVFPVTEAFLGD
jgi:hypothetical protein